jgi:Enoyl-CoA hydratase/isomerase
MLPWRIHQNIFARGSGRHSSGQTRCPRCTCLRCFGFVCFIIPPRWAGGAACRRFVSRCRRCYRLTDSQYFPKRRQGSAFIAQIGWRLSLMNEAGQCSRDFAHASVSLQLAFCRRNIQKSKLRERDRRNMNQQPTASKDLLFETREGIGRVTFNCPQARNALTFAMYELLAQVCHQANLDRSIKVVVFQGAGDKAFASGTDIDQFRAFTTPDQAIEHESQDGVLFQVEQCRDAHNRGNHWRLYRWRRRHSGVLRFADRDQHHENRISDRAHARQLPLDVEYQPAHRLDRTGASYFHCLTRRRRGGRQRRFAQ